MAELFGLHARLEHAGEAERPALEHRHAALDVKMRAWPRTPDNDPFYAGSSELAAQLRRVTGNDVIVGFNEFCAPSLDDALAQAVAQAAERIIVITPMMTQGGQHSEVDIPAAIRRMQERRPDIPIVYAWPFAVSEVARFLAGQISRYAG
jgi:sirohydrochlorin cobaltochelatase